MNKKSITDIDVLGKKVLLRCDFNVPLDSDGNITDDNRITGALPTIKYLMEHGARLILCSHMGRPKGEFNMKYTLAPVAKRLSELLGKDIPLAPDVIGDKVVPMVDALGNGDAMLLENVRFYKQEEKNDPAFSKSLADLAEVYVNDAFGTAHRAHCSTEGVAAYLPGVCGFLIQKEIEIIGGALDNPQRPFVAILGGAKVSDKIGVINNLLDKVDTLIIGGGMAGTFFVAQGYSVGKSLCEYDKVDLAKELIQKAKDKGVKLLVPVDGIIGDAFSPDANAKEVTLDAIPEEWSIFDIGQQTIKLFTDALDGAKTVIWNGPVGVFEFDKFASGTKAVAEKLASMDTISIIGGGDTAAAIEKFGFASKMRHISTGGGASLEYMEGIVLPGIAALQDK